MLYRTYFMPVYWPQPAENTNLMLCRTRTVLYGQRDAVHKGVFLLFSTVK
jgi:hypothetical protein